MSRVTFVNGIPIEEEGEEDETNSSPNNGVEGDSEAVQQEEEEMAEENEGDTEGNDGDSEQDFQGPEMASEDIGLERTDTQTPEDEEPGFFSEEYWDRKAREAANAAEADILAFNRHTWAGQILTKGIDEAGYFVQGLFVPKETEEFNLEETLDADAVPAEDREKYDGCNTRRRYEFVRNQIAQERADEEFIAQHQTKIGWLANMSLDLMAFSKAGKAVGEGLKAVTKAVPAIANWASKAERASRWSGIFGKTEPWLEEAAKIAGFSGVLAETEYLTKYDCTAEEARGHFYTYCLFGAFLSGGVQLAKPVLKKMVDSGAKWFINKVNAADPDKFIMDEVQKAREEILEAIDPEPDVKGNLVEKLMKIPGFRSCPQMMLFSESPEIRELAKLQTKFSSDVVRGARERNAENIWELEAKRDAHLAEKISKTLQEKNAEIKAFDGRTDAFEWFAQSYYGVDLPFDLPEKATIENFAKQFRERWEGLDALQEEVHGKITEMRDDLMPGDIAISGRLKVDEIAKNFSKGEMGLKRSYVRQKLDPEKIRRNEGDFKRLLERYILYSRGENAALNLIKEKITGPFPEIEGPSFEEIIEYIRENPKIAPEIKKAVKNSIGNIKAEELAEDVESFYDAMIQGGKRSGGSAGIRTDTVKERVLRIDPTVLYQYMKTDTLQSLIRDLSRRRAYLLYEKSFKELGYKDFDDFYAKTQKRHKAQRIELNKKKFGSVEEKITALNNLEKKQELDEMLLRQNRIEWMDKAGLLVEGEGGLTPKEVAGVEKWLEAGRNMAYSVLLGKVLLVSLRDVQSLIARTGISKAFGDLATALPTVLLKNSKSELKEILEILETHTNKNEALTALRRNVADADIFTGTRTGLSEKVLETSQKLARATVKYSGIEAWDNIMRVAATRGALRQELKGIAGKGEWQNYLKKLKKANPYEFESLQLRIQQRVDEAMNVYSMADKPMVLTKGSKYGAVLRAIFQLKSWAMAHTRNFIYPLLNGSFAMRNVVQMAFGGFSIALLEQYLKKSLSATPYNEDELIRDTTKSWAEDFVPLQIQMYAGTLIDILNGKQRRVTSSVSPSLSGIARFFDAINLGRKLINYKWLNGDENFHYKSVYRALEGIPVVGVPWLHPIKKALAEEISGERSEE